MQDIWDVTPKMVETHRFRNTGLGARRTLAMPHAAGLIQALFYLTYSFLSIIIIITCVCVCDVCHCAYRESIGQHGRSRFCPSTLCSIISSGLLGKCFFISFFHGAAISLAPGHYLPVDFQWSSEYQWGDAGQCSPKKSLLHCVQLACIGIYWEEIELQGIHCL